MTNPTRCDHETDPRTGVCVWCDHAPCNACGTPVPAADAHPVAWVPGAVAPGVLCEACLAAGEDDSDGVPVAVDEESSGAQTVRERTLSDSELLALVDMRRAA